MMSRHPPVPYSTLPLWLLPALLLLTGPLRAQGWASVSVGDDHVCALDERGRAYCFGNNHAGQLGARTPVVCGIVGESGRRSCYPTPSESGPLRAGGGLRFAAVSAGRYLTCGVDAEGGAFCWGEPIDDPSGYADECLHGQPCSFAPVPLLPGRRFARVDMKPRCAVEREGTALCWSDDRWTSVHAVTPWADLEVAQVDGSLLTETFCAVARSGPVFCEGDGSFGELGAGREDAVEGMPVESPARFRQVAVVETWICGLDAEGAAHCWGAAAYGDAPPDSAREGFDRCARWGTETWCNLRPAPVAGGLRFGAIVPAPRGTMPVVSEMVGITASGAAFVWGGDRVPHPWHPEHDWRSVGAGAWGQCGVSAAGELFCWGRDPHEEVQGRIPHPEPG
jgi:hypothetical protein